MDVFNPLDPDFIRDPYPRYQALRDRDPVHRSAAGFWVLTRYEDVAAGLKDRRLSNKPAAFAIVNRRNTGRHLAAEVANNLIAFLDPPEHSTRRKLIATALQEYLKGKEPVVREIAEELLARLGAGTVDFVGDVTIPFATRCVCRLMGFPEEDAVRLKNWSGMFFYLFHSIPSAEVLEQVNRSLGEFRAYIRERLEERKHAPRDDLLTLLMQASRAEYSLVDNELVDNCMLLAADGIENVQTGLAAAVATLLKNKDQLRLAMEKPELFDAAVDECLRCESPGQYQGRISLETIEMGGKTIRANSVVLLVLASANRDPRAFPDPERFLVEREGPRHLAFGLGRHACIGGILVAMEFRSFFRVLFDGYRSIELNDPILDWTARAGHRWLAALRLTISPDY